ncbi:MULTISPECIES: Cys-tRNA(Pro) deacylase [Calditerrivibrio]|uniref:Cys-tRNA(Pro)/Cys-tRNA(Cys) deacylase n=1 Tax=Calditerrivibrio nitroreducens TaxID=477976 RepID=A0A2J6WQW4_9BACT|nr:MAG: Cys-tRNA(Pro) deacylase [Calditerrivibrio nitroreducens]
MSEKFPITPVTRLLDGKKIIYGKHLYEYEEKGGTRASSMKLGVDEHTVIKTIVMEDETKKPLIVLMHGDMEISTKNLARFLGVKTINPCTPEVAQKHTGYLVGGTSPFGTKKQLPIFMEKTILDLEKIFINGGKRGFLISINPQIIVDILKPTLVEVGYR